MPGVDERVRDAVEGLVEPAAVEAIFADVAARRDRRRRTRRAAVVIGAITAVGCVGALTEWADEPSQSVFAGQPEETTTTVAPAPPPEPPPPPESNGGFALWPEDTAAEWQAAGEKPAWRLDPVETVRHFAADVLGWTDPTPPEQIMTEAYGRHYRIAREPGGPVEIVHMEQLQPCTPGPGCQAGVWSVMAVSDDPMPCEDPAYPECFTLAITVQGQDAHLQFGMLGAASADVEVSFGTAVTGTTTTGEIILALDRDPASPGSVLLRFRDAQGQVFRAFGYVLGPGDSNGP